jgi:NAD+ synthase (glutamine-hydrolysing)
MAQLDFLVGDIQGNIAKIITATLDARDRLRADAIVFPELTVTGYPPEDLLLRPSFIRQLEPAMQRLCVEIKGIAAVVGYPTATPEGLHNSAAVIRDGVIQAIYHKQLLPNYSVFDEKRYFVAGAEPTIVTIKGVRVGITICEDMWQPDPVQKVVAAGAQLLLNLNASPFHAGKGQLRLNILRQRVAENGVPIVYVNLIGGQDELVFDGHSQVVNSYGELTHRAPFCTKGLYPVDFAIGATVEPISGEIAGEPSEEAAIYQAIVRECVTMLPRTVSQAW